MASKRLPDIFYNWMSAVGAVLAVATFSIIVLLLLIDVFVRETTLYLGILTFMILPAFVVLGLLLIAAGALMERRRQARGVISTFPKEIHIDLENSRHRNAVLIWTAGTALFLAGTAAGTYKAYQVTESVAFCGELCHGVMAPEYTAYQISPHARVSCAECHIGSGADWFVKAKITGAYQVYAVLANVYPKPIPTPIEDLRPARETCEHCHWPDKFFGSRKRVVPHFLSDEANTPYPISLLLNVGGGDTGGHVEGIHWHISQNHKMEYRADRSRQNIAYVRMTDELTGDAVEYTPGGKPLSEDQLASMAMRTVDCMDCHNRPSHHYLSPVRSVNAALHRGRLDVSLPYIKREAVLALDREYEDTPSALQAIEAHLTGFYQSEYPEVVAERGAVVQQAVAGVQAIYRENFFPEMKVSWKAYPDHVGHSEFSGCFRCHGSELATADGKGISSDCSLCHVILAQGITAGQPTLSPEGLTFVHPVDVGGAEMESHCTDCHSGGAELY